MGQKIYAVKRGRHPGIYLTWPACQKEVNGFPGAIFKGFTDQQAAKQWLAEPIQQRHQGPNQRPKQKSLNLAFTSTKPAATAIRLYTDGGSRNHGNKLGQHVKKTDKAAWAFLVQVGTQQHTATGGEYGSTNNKMEVTALIQALHYLIAHRLNNRAIIATLDSHYVLDPITKGWLYGWRRRQWKTAAGKPVANQELWAEVLRLLSQFDNLRFTWTKGHADNQGNNIVDELLNTTMDKM